MQFSPAAPDRRANSSPDDYNDVAGLFERVAELGADDGLSVREEIVTRCLPLAEHIARRFCGRGEPYDDLVQVARLGLVNAVDRFDVARGSDFVSFAVPTIMGEVRRHFRDTGWAMRVPRRMKELHLRIAKAVGVLSQRLGRAPTASEIAAEMGIAVDEVSEGLIAGSAYQTISIDAAVGDREYEVPLAETLGVEDDALATVEEFTAVGPALARLPERERTILVLRFYGSMTQTQIAERLGISQMHVSRILSRTLRRLRDELSAD
ncbi:SigB/SigF/SigG family RNA polymerase sigma factor [Rhodococcus spelaei]|uniref:SigB/SigF/SigG family RNA polymerase sigma factor n=1 Tax=Rhodococcus spelaei TaxID=2546320 RepID=A0A541B7M7_9NOCA|nr:SigB/SigF/SigG family RNA polymerase sigma factor [Rhodococcus spelaei]TQF68314.1 SigB/SigF/SigG family RNA polymerase sigma factor [Rhodococcus spelaei]